MIKDLNNIFRIVILLFFFKIILSCSGQEEKNTFSIEAIEYNNKAMEIYTNYRAVHVSECVGEMEKAISFIDSAISIDSSYYIAYYNKVNILSKLERYSQAIEVLSKVIINDTNNAKAYSLRGFFFEKKGDIRRAEKDYNLSIRAYDKNIEENPDNITYKTERIFMTLFVSNKKTANTQLEELRKSHPNNFEVKMMKKIIQDFDRKKYINDI